MVEQRHHLGDIERASAVAADGVRWQIVGDAARLEFRLDALQRLDHFRAQVAGEQRQHVLAADLGAERLRFRREQRIECVDADLGAFELGPGVVEMVGGVGAADDVVSEYMCENISDENDRLVEKKTDEISSSRKKEKIVEITKVEFLDKNEHERSAFETGETVSVRVSFKIHEHKERFNFGLGLYNLENNYILGINTVFDSIETKPYLEKGYFQVDFNDISLNSNSYYILAGIGGNDFNVLYDLLPKSHYFRVISNSKHEGIVRLDYGWK